jgi:hypothetical protein
MDDSILPSSTRFTSELMIVGQLLAGYGELELGLATCAWAANGDLNSTLKTMFGARGEARRIHLADAMMKSFYHSAGLGPDYDTAMADMDWCRELRNQYAHCHRYDAPEEGLYFVDLEQAAKMVEPIANVTDGRKPIDLILLIEQHDFFKYVQRCFWHLENTYKQRLGRPFSKAFTLPTRMERPLKDN